jgi:hypothetical protein
LTKAFKKIRGSFKGNGGLHNLHEEEDAEKREQRPERELDVTGRGPTNPRTAREHARQRRSPQTTTKH